MPKTFKVEFTQVTMGSWSGKVKESQGEIDYENPAKIRFKILSPRPSEFVSNGKKSWFYTPAFMQGEKGEVIVQTSNKVVLSKFFDRISQGLTSNSLYTVKASNNRFELLFSPVLQKELGMEKSVILFNEGKNKNFQEIQSIELNYKDKKPVVLKFKKMVTPAMFSGGHFIFEIPKETNISGS